MYKKILAEIDERIASESVARYALKFAKLVDALLYLCFIHKKEVKFEKAEAALKRVFLEAEKKQYQS